MEIAPDALLIDYQLDHGANGLELAAALHRRHGACPTRIISAERSASLRDSCAEMGLELMPKPLDTEALFRFLAEIPPT